MVELFQQSKRRGEVIHKSQGINDAVSTALDRSPDEFTPARVLVTAWLFEHGSSTASEASDATGVSYLTAKDTLDALVDAELAHTNSTRTFEGRGRTPTVYVPAPDSLPEIYR